MKRRFEKVLLVSVAALSIASVGVASAKQGPDDPGKGGKVGKGPVAKGQAYTFHGVYTGTDGLTAGQISVTISNGNKWVRRAGLVGQTVVFDASTAKIKVADMNTDGLSNLSDLVTGDRVMLQGRLPRDLPLTPPLKAWKVVDKTNPPVSPIND